MRCSKVGALALCVFVAACGGEDGSSGKPVTIPPTTVTPTPSPTPSPVDYSAFDFSKPLSIQADSLAEMRTVNICRPEAPSLCTFSTGSSLLDTHPSTAFRWDPTKSDLTITGRTTELFLGSDKLPYSDGPYPLVYSWQKDTFTTDWLDKQVILTLWHLWDEKEFHIVTVGEVELERSLASVPKQLSRRTRQYLVGKKTAPADIPASGTVQFYAGFTASQAWEDGIMSLGWNYRTSIDVDFSAHTLHGSAEAFSVSYPAGRQPLSVRLTLNATFDPATGRITGMIRSVDGDYSGTVTGFFYGPAAAEAGLNIAMTWNQGRWPMLGVIALMRN